jgi:uncharacterized cofD-like protein
VKEPPVKKPFAARADEPLAGESRISDSRVLDSRSSEDFGDELFEEGDNPPVPLRAVPLRAPREWRSVKWLTPGIGIKRWGVMALVGLACAVTGAIFAGAEFSLNVGLSAIEWIYLITGRYIDPVALGIIFLFFGTVLVIVGLRGTMGAVERAFSETPDRRADFLETALKRIKMDHGERVVAIGGGTGLSTMLRGLKQYSSNITAVVTMADDGGSSGLLRDEGMLPPGDLRNCMAALADAEPQMTALFQHRFEGLGPLKGHSVGNLIVAAMCEMTGDFEGAVRETSRVLAIRGKVLPSTLEDVRLGAELENGDEVLGQVSVNKATNIRRAFLRPDAPHALPGAVQAIIEADVIIIGPGSLFTSIIPNLLVPEIAEAIKKSKAPKIYVCNVMTQPGETAGFKASDHVKAIIRHIGPDVVDYALLNNGRVSENVLARYRRVGAEYVEPDEDAISMLGVRPLHGNFINTTNLVRHDSQKLATTIFRVIGRM